MAVEEVDREDEDDRQRRFRAVDEQREVEHPSRQHARRSVTLP
jgi:hypothetical protein